MNITTRNFSTLGVCFWLAATIWCFSSFVAHASEIQKRFLVLKPLAPEERQMFLGTVHAGHLLSESFESAANGGETFTFLQDGVGKKMLLVSRVGAVVSVFEIIEGVSELQAGKKFDGFKHLSVGASVATSSIAARQGSHLLCHSAGAIGAGIDGALDLCNGISRHNWEKTAVGSVKTTVCILLVSSAAQPELAPVLTPIAFVTYSGAVIVDVAYENQEVIGETVYGTWGDTKDCAQSTCEFYSQSAKAVCRKAGKYCSSLKQGYDQQMGVVAMSVYESSQEIKSWLHL